jgi:hypothetical protein
VTCAGSSLSANDAPPIGCLGRSFIFVEGTMPASRALWQMLRCLVVAAVIAGLPEMAAAGAGAIVGKIDGISRDGDQTFLSGWACQQGQSRSIAIHVFADHFADNTQAVAFVVAGVANLDSEPAIGQACQDGHGGKHRFVVELPGKLTNKRVSKIDVRGIRIVDGVENAAIAGSGTVLAGLPAVAMQFPTLATFHPLSGTYRQLAEHPRVFTTAAELRDIATRINRADSYSMRRFGQLVAQIKRDLAAPVDWSATYSGCNMGIYLYAFSYEPQDGDAATTVHATLKLAANVEAPRGAAVIASRLALYAALVKAGLCRRRPLRVRRRQPPWRSAFFSPGVTMAFAMGRVTFFPIRSFATATASLPIPRCISRAASSIRSRRRIS